MWKGSLGSALLAAMLALPTSAPAAPTWLPEQTLTAPGVIAQQANGAMGANGTAVTSWYSSTGLHAAIRPPYGSFGPSTTLDPGGTYSIPSVDAAGDVAIVWFDGSSPESAWLARAPRGGGFGTAIPLGTTGHRAVLPVVALDARGDLVAAWEDETDNQIEARYWPAGGSLGPVKPISPALSYVAIPQVAIDDAGDVTAVWNDASGGSELTSVVTRNHVTGAWSPPMQLAPSANHAHITVNSRGDTVASWDVSSGNVAVVQAALRPAGSGFFGATLTLSPVGDTATLPTNALDDHGDAIVAWVRHDRVETRRDTALGAFGPVNTPAGGSSTLPVLASDARGDTLLGYVDASTGQLGAAFQPAGGQWGTPTLVSSPAITDGTPPGYNGYGVALDAQGDGLLSYAAHTPTDTLDTVAGASFLDSAGPQLGTTILPSAGTALAPVHFAVSPRDQLSALGRTTWSFGDGSTSSAASVAHSFAHPGTYIVSVTSTDVLGNATAHSASVRISAAPFSVPKLRRTKLALDSRGRFTLRLRCAKLDPCAGRVLVSAKLRATPALLHTLARTAHAARGSSLVVVLGSARFSARGGRSASVRIKLPNGVAKLVRRRHPLHAAAQIDAHDGFGRAGSRTQKLSLTSTRR